QSCAMEETTPLFLGVAIVFALSVPIASIGTAISQGLSTYESRNLGSVFLLATSPIYTVLALSSKTLRRKRLRRNLTSLAVILVSPAVVYPLFGQPRWHYRRDVICFNSSYSYIPPAARYQASYY